MNILCTICSDIVNQADSIYVTKCGHVFHHHCLSQWIERSKTCPQCRNKVTEKCMFRLYLTISNESSGEDAGSLQAKLDDAQLQLRQQKALLSAADEKRAALQSDIKEHEGVLKRYKSEITGLEAKVVMLREKLDFAEIMCKDRDKLKQENESLRKNKELLNGLQTVLNATVEEVNEMLVGYTDLRTMATFATALKRALRESESKRSETTDRLHAAKRLLALEKKNVADLQTKVIRVEDDYAHMKHEYEQLKLKKSKLKAGVRNDEASSSSSPSRPNVDTEHSITESDNNNSYNNNSFNTIVNKIEMSDSPYLNLKQSSLLSLSALQRQPVNIANSRLKPSELVFMNAIKKKSTVDSKPSTSIFHTKEPIKMGSFDDVDTASLDISYDGLGGHSKVDKFPVPKVPIKSCIPKLSAKHKLKRPSGGQTITDMFKRSKDS